MDRAILKGVQETKDFLDTLGANVAFDTETTALKYTELELEGISICDGQKACYIDLVDNFDSSEVIAAVAMFFDSVDTIVCHNIVFDMKVLYKYGIDLRDKKLYDTMVGDHLIDETRRHGLKFLAQHLLGHEVISYEEARARGANSDVFYKYATDDAVWTWELMRLQQPLLKADKELASLFRDVEMPFQLVLFEMELNGIHIDTKELSKLYEQAKKDKVETQIAMCDYLNREYTLQTDLFNENITFISPINFNSTAQLKQILFTDLGLKPVEETPSGGVGVGKITLKEYKDHDFVRLLYKYKIIEKALSAYLGPESQILSNLEKDGVVRTSFKDTGTKTGRLSSSNPNIQQLSKPDDIHPIPIRKCFISKPGYTMITADYSGQEICVMAEISKDETLVSSLNNGYDMHLAIANQFYNLGIPKEALSTNHQDYDSYKKEHGKARSQAKTITFGLAYGKGSYGFSKDFSISEDEAQKIVDDYFNGLPDLKRAIDQAHKEVWDTGMVKYMSGRARHFTKITKEGWEGYTKKDLRQAFNAKIQGYSADMIRIACNNIYNNKKEYPHIDLRMLGTVHDEIVAEVRTEHLEEAKVLLKKWMEEPFDWMCVPITSDISTGANYDEAK